MADKKDYYELLGVSRTAPADEIKKAYRKLAMKYHPDHAKGDKTAEERFKKISEAYAVLSDKEKRREYDTFGSEGFRQRFSQEDIFRGFDFGDIFGDRSSENIFSRIFGGQRGARPRGRSRTFSYGGPEAHYEPISPPKGQDLLVDVPIKDDNVVIGHQQVDGLGAVSGGPVPFRHEIEEGTMGEDDDAVVFF